MNPELEKAKKSLGDKLHQLGLWCVVLILAGAWGGYAYANKENKNKLTESIEVGAFLHKGEVYTITKRELTKE